MSAAYGFDGGFEIVPPKGWVILREGSRVPPQHREYVKNSGWAEPRSDCSTMTPVNAKIHGRVLAFAVPVVVKPAA